jgi:Tol biopolymer transport system component
VFGTARGGSQPYLTHRLVRRAANGTGDEELLYETESPTYAAAPVDWSPDGHYLLFAQANAATFATVSEIWILSMSGAPAAAPLLQTPFRVRSATVSPDGAWLAYSTTESGTDQIMVQSFPDTSRGKWRISAGGGTEPRWRRDGASSTS